MQACSSRSAGSCPSAFSSVSDDSRTVKPGALFIAVRGSARDGHDYLGPAEAAGATAAILEDPQRTRLPALVVREGRAAAALVAAAAYRVSGQRCSAARSR